MRAYPSSNNIIAREQLHSFSAMFLILQFHYSRKAIIIVALMWTIVMAGVFDHLGSNMLGHPWIGYTF